MRARLFMELSNPTVHPNPPPTPGSYTMQHYGKSAYTLSTIEQVQTDIMQVRGCAVRHWGCGTKTGSDVPQRTIMGWAGLFAHILSRTPPGPPSLLQPLYHPFLCSTAA